MPRVSEFYGIVILMFHTDHPPPHFHAVYGEYEAVVGIDPIETKSGRLPHRAQRFVFEWASLHQQELMDNWGRARQLDPLMRIEPLA